MRKPQRQTKAALAAIKSRGLKLGIYAQEPKAANRLAPRPPMPQSRWPDPEKGPPLRNRAAASASAARAGSRLALFARGRHGPGAVQRPLGLQTSLRERNMLSRSYPCGSPATSNSIIGPRIGLSFSNSP